MVTKKITLFLVLSALSQTFLVSNVFAQTSTTRADRAVYSTFSIWGKPIINGAEAPGWINYGQVNFNIEVSESQPGKLHYRLLQKTMTPGTNVALSMPDWACNLENEGTRLRCYYVVTATVKSQKMEIKQTATYKVGGTAGVIANTPIGLETKIEGSGETESKTEQNTAASEDTTFSRYFDFVVHLRNSCTTNPGYSVYYRGHGDTPAFVHSQCTTPVAQGTKYCGNGSTTNRMANGVVDGQWHFQSSSPSDRVTLQHRTYRLYRNGGPTNITVTNECHIGLSTRHVFPQYDWYWGNKRTNITYVRREREWCEYTADVFEWDPMTRDYTRFLRKQNFGSGGCVGSSSSDKVITAPSTVKDY